MEQLSIFQYSINFRMIAKSQLLIIILQQFIHINTDKILGVIVVGDVDSFHSVTLPYHVCGKHWLSTG